MSLSEDLPKVIEKANEENAAEEHVAREFDKQWGSLRTGLILDVFRETAKILSAAKVGGLASPNNGVEVILFVKAAPDHQRYEHNLKFYPRKDLLKVICASPSIPDYPEEPFEIESLTREKIEDKVKDFVYRALRCKTPPAVDMSALRAELGKVFNR